MSSQPRDLGVQGHGWRLLARPGCAPGRLDSCLRAGRLGEPEVLAWGRDMRPLSNQGNSRHQSHRTCAGERGLGSAVPPQRAPCINPHCSPWGFGGGAGQAQTCSCSPTSAPVGTPPLKSQPTEKPTQDSPLARPSPTQSQPAPQPEGLTHLPTGKRLTAQVGKCLSRPKTKTPGEGGGWGGRVSPQHPPRRWECERPCKAGPVGAKGTLLVLAGRVWHSPG